LTFSSLSRSSKELLRKNEMMINNSTLVGTINYFAIFDARTKSSYENNKKDSRY
jgi:hypothetical protein